MSEIKRLFAVGRLETKSVGKRVPSPVAHGTEGNTVLVVAYIGLHTRDVNRCSKMAIANSQGCQRVSFGNDGVVAKKNSLAIYRGCYVFGGVSKHLHLKRSPYKRSDTLGIVVTDGFREIVFVAAVAPLVLLDASLGIDHLHGSLYFGRCCWPQTCNGAAVGQRNSLVAIDTNHVIDDTLVGANACIAVLVADIALAIGFEQDIGKHARCSRFKIVAFAVRRIHDLIPCTSLLVLPLDDSVQVLLQEFDNLLLAGVIVGQNIEHLD